MKLSEKLRALAHGQGSQEKYQRCCECAVEAEALECEMSNLLQRIRFDEEKAREHLSYVRMTTAEYDHAKGRR